MEVNVEKYLTVLTGDEVRLVPYVVRGPLYLKRFPAKSARIFGRDVVFAFVKDESLSPSEYRDYAAQLYEKTGCPVVFVFQSVNGSRRNAFLRTSVGFIVPMNQMFIPPFIDVREWMPKVRETKNVLGNVAQVLVLREIAKGDVEGMTFCHLAGRFGYSPTVITDASADLASHGLAEVVGGRPKSLRFNAHGEDLWKLSKGILRSPVKRMLLNRLEPSTLPCAGLTALARRSMLSAPVLPVFAAMARVLKDPTVYKTADSKDEAKSEIEVWNYDPCVIGEDGVDRYSLYLSMKDVSDPRVKGELEDMMESGK